MSPQPASPPFKVDDAMIDQAAESLDIAGRLAGRNGLLLMDVAAPRSGELAPDLHFLAEAAVGLHLAIQDDDDLSDIQEALGDPLRADDQHGIDEACDQYRALLSSRLKALAGQTDGSARLVELQRAGRKA
ncbi:MAG TPA: hypothetical protein VG960_00455 [Caulobacteraceae bacterium]|nr:hypothetical protein [Caulobacteraceae bacterium]